jgi:hypothetical protein
MFVSVELMELRIGTTAVLLLTEVIVLAIHDSQY